MSSNQRTNLLITTAVAKANQVLKWYEVPKLILFCFYSVYVCFSYLMSHSCLCCLQSRQSEPQSKMVKMSPPSKDEDEGGEEDEEDDEQGATCGACGDSYGTDEFWICCDICERWFHGKCVKITPAKAEHIKQYKCPSCSSKRARV